jgi:hypothetical protein
MDKRKRHYCPKGHVVGFICWGGQSELLFRVFTATKTLFCSSKTGKILRKTQKKALKGVYASENRDGLKSFRKPHIWNIRFVNI